MSDDRSARAEAAPPRTRLAAGAPWPRVAALADARHAPIDSEALFGGADEVEIAHRGVVYRLRRTSLGKLILTK